MGGWGFKFGICIKSTEHFLELDWLAISEKIYFFCFDFFFFSMYKIVYGADGFILGLIHTMNQC